jgi:hypothetical protein
MKNILLLFLTAIFLVSCSTSGKSASNPQSSGNSSTSSNDDAVIDLSSRKSLPSDLTEHLTYGGQGGGEGGNTDKKNPLRNMNFSGYKPGERLRILFFYEVAQTIDGMDVFILEFITEQYMDANSNGNLVLDVSNYDDSKVYHVLVIDEAGNVFGQSERGFTTPQGQFFYYDAVDKSSPFMNE